MASPASDSAIVFLASMAFNAGRTESCKALAIFAQESRIFGDEGINLFRRQLYLRVLGGFAPGMPHDARESGSDRAGFEKRYRLAASDVFPVLLRLWRRLFDGALGRYRVDTAFHNISALGMTMEAMTSQKWNSPCMQTPLGFLFVAARAENSRHFQRSGVNECALNNARLRR